MLAHFKINTSLISQVHLVDVTSREIIWGDASLTKTRYLMGFSRLGKAL